MPKKPTAVEELNYEQAFAELCTIIETLENEESALDDAIRLFERGQALAKHCGELLDTAELRVRQLDLSQGGALDEDEEADPSEAAE
jgi:exodeoxyribonuclease VII small subunit